MLYPLKIKIMKPKILLLLIFCFSIVEVKSQEMDTVQLDYKKIYSYTLNGKIIPVLELLDTVSINNLSKTDKEFKDRFEQRFRYAEDKSNYLNTIDSSVIELVKIYRDYWRNSMLNQTIDDESLKDTLYSFFRISKHPLFKKSNKRINRRYIKYLNSKGVNSTPFGKTGSFYDLLLWKNEKDTIYNISIPNDTVYVKVCFMDNFITLGWMEYATLGKSKPGGWATADCLFFVKKAYDVSAESFKISYLVHKAQHFYDYKLFPELTQPDLEYRAKLAELSYANETIYKLIETFIINAEYNRQYAHSFANYCVIRDLSRAVFNNDFENNLEKWKSIDKNLINETCKEILLQNTEILRKQGRDIKEYLE